jgi:hypothetical protein
MGFMRRERETCGREHVANLHYLFRRGTRTRYGHVVVDYYTQLHKANDPPPIPVVEELS